MSATVERRSILIPARTVLVAAGCAGALWLLVRLWPALLVVAMALILVGTLNPIVGALQRRGLRRGAAVAAVLLTLLVVLTGLARVLLGLETIVGGYVRGQILTSAAIGLYVFSVLTLLRMPSAVAFGVFAAAADVLPLVGGALTLAPIALAALPHGTGVTIVLVALVVLYQELENRVIVPRVYGRELRLDAVAVTIALLVGAELLGVLGALLALPIAAGLRMVVEELRVELPGQPGEASDARAREEQRAEETYAALTAGTPAKEAAVVAVAIADEIRKRGATPGPRVLRAAAKH